MPKTVGDDAGHGMSNTKPGVVDPGAVDPRDPKRGDNIYTREDKINQIMANLFNKDMVAGKHPVDILTGPLLGRANKANKDGVVAGISWHCDSGVSTARGLTIYYSGSKSSMVLATHVQTFILPILKRYGVPYRGIKEHPKHLVMLEDTKAPWLLVEIGFISNVKEEVTINDKHYQADLAAAVARGYARYIGG